MVSLALSVKIFNGYEAVAEGAREHISSDELRIKRQKSRNSSKTSRRLVYFVGLIENWFYVRLFPGTQKFIGGLLYGICPKPQLTEF